MIKMMDGLTFRNMLEIVNTINGSGKFTNTILGNLDPVTGTPVEIDSNVSTRLIITKPLGGMYDVNYGLYVLIASSVAIVLGTLIIIDKRRKKK